VIAIAIFAASIAYLCAYLTVGWKLAMRDIPNARRRAEAAWHHSDIVRTSVKEQTVCMVLFWPLLLPWRRMNTKFGHVIDNHDPSAINEQIRERDQRIAELERELGLK
jgi:hypothetical protein